MYETDREYNGLTLDSRCGKLSGAWQTVTTGVDRALNGQAGTQRPNLVSGNGLVANHGGACANVAPCVEWLTNTAFSNPAFGTFGNLGRSNVPGLGFFAIDVALSRLFRIRESKTLEARGEAIQPHQ